VVKSLVLDANILMRAVLGRRAAQRIRGYATTVLFLTVAEAFETEDRDFFSCGIPLWTTDRVEIYLQ
jgi:hypothetical protein